jgi:predicted nucleotidyltransferase
MRIAASPAKQLIFSRNCGILLYWIFQFFGQKMKEEIFEKDINEVIRISKEYGAEEVFLFGSCLEESESANDIDIAVKGVNPEKFFEMYGKILGAAKSQIDLIPIEHVREHFASNILARGRRIYGKQI